MPEPNAKFSKFLATTLYADPAICRLPTVDNPRKPPLIEKISRKQGGVSYGVRMETIWDGPKKTKKTPKIPLEMPKNAIFFAPAARFSPKSP